MPSLKFVVLAVTLVVAVSAYGPPKKSAALPPSVDKYDTVGSIDEKKGQEDVLYVKGQPVESGKEELVDETDGAYGGKYGNAEKKIKEVKVEESGLDLGPAGGEYGEKPVGGHGKGKKAYGGGKSFTKEVKEVKYDAIDDKGGKFGPEDDKFEEVKEETKYGGEEIKEEKKYGRGKGYGAGGEYGGKSIGKAYDGGKSYTKELKEETKYDGEEIKEEKKYDDKGYGGPKKEIIIEEVIKEDKGGKFGPEEGKFEEDVKEVKEEKKYDDKGYRGPKKEIIIEEVIKEDKGGKFGTEEGKFEDGKFEEEVKEIKEEKKYGGGKGYGGPKKVIIKEEVIKEEGGYAPGKGFQGGYLPEAPRGGYGPEIPNSKKSYGGYGPKGGFGYEEKEIKTKYGGGYEKPIEDLGGYGPKPEGSITTMSTKACNKLVDGLLGKLQHSFTDHMKSYKLEKVSPVSIGSWARVRLYDGKFDKIGKICRGDDFQVLPQGENIVIRGLITVPEPQAKFCGDAYLYNRLKVRNRNLNLCAKDASFRMQMIINKRANKIDLDELEPVGIHGFHVEDDKGLRSDGLAWPFNKIRDTQLSQQKYQFMSTLQHKLCNDFRQIVARPDIKQEIIRLV